MSIIPDTTHISKWSTQKKRAKLVAKHMRLASGLYPALRGRAYRMSHCSDTIAYEVLQDGSYRYAGACLCRDKLCPVCAWRLAVKRTGEMIKTIDKLVEIAPKTTAIHIVLTVKNCQANELRSVLQAMSDGFARLRRRQLWKDYILGYARSIEVTYNSDAGTYHPHIHAVCIVPDTYTRQISIGDWIELWRDCARLSYRPIVWASHAYNSRTTLYAEASAHAYKLEDNTEAGAAKAAIVEALKYSIKPDTLITAAQAGDIGEIAIQMAGIRTVSYGGILKIIRQQLGITGDEPSEQLPAEVVNPSGAVDRYYVLYEWSGQAYGIVRKVTLPASA